MRSWREVLPERDRAVYEKSGRRERQPFGKNPALLIIDVTTEFIGRKPEDVLQSVEEFRTSCGEVGWTALPNIKRILDACRDKGLCVVYTRGNQVTRKFIGMATKGRERADSPAPPPGGNEIAETIAPREDEWVLEKPRASAFFGTPLATYLHQQGVDSILVTGCTTSGCVRASVVDAFAHGFGVFVVEEGVFDRAEMSHLVSLYEMNAKYADVITLDEALEHVS
ncbi:MAG: isochorismatase family protein [Chloroflexi bacterium]|nr:isochorismatase family protein [Chloroflexota bacterium]